MPDNSPLIAAFRGRLCSRTYTDQFDGLSDMDFTPYPFYASCGDCGWEGPSRDTRAEAERDRWRHPDLPCWLRALWIDWRPVRG